MEWSRGASRVLSGLSAAKDGKRAEGEGGREITDSSANADAAAFEENIHERLSLSLPLFGVKRSSLT